MSSHGAPDGKKPEGLPREAEQGAPGSLERALGHLVRRPTVPKLVPWIVKP